MNEKIVLSVDDLQRVIRGDEVEINTKNGKQILLEADALELKCLYNINLSDTYNKKELGTILTNRY